MITFDDIKACYNKLSRVQQALVSELVAYELANINSSYSYIYNISAYIESAQQFLKDGNINEELDDVDYIDDVNYTNDDLNAVIQYLEYANSYEFPTVYFLDIDDENRIISEDDFDCKSLFDYIDVKSTIDNLERTFFDFVIDPERHDEPDLCYYNDQMFEDEMNDYIEQHNKEVVQKRKETDYFLISDDRLDEDLLSTDEDVLLEKIKSFEGEFEIKNLDGNELREKFCDEDNYLDYIRDHLI